MLTIPVYPSLDDSVCSPETHAVLHKVWERLMSTGV